MGSSPSDLPSPLWFAIPLLLVPLGLYTRSLLLERKKKRTGIGRGVAGFQTGVKRLAVPPEIAERLRRGEQVSAEEITAATESATREKSAEAPPQSTKPASRPNTPSSAHSSAVGPVSNDEWVPEHLRQQSGTKKRSKKR